MLKGEEADPSILFLGPNQVTVDPAKTKKLLQNKKDGKAMDQGLGFGIPYNAIDIFKPSS